ncbi:MAG: carbohydrate kinase, partial [Akkermansiaceae bacterium]|nr:carbohydrate kinase [Akkermansiaceae bacterium]
LGSLGATVGGTIYATGGAARSPLGLQVRADLLGKVLCVPAHPNSAMGAAVLAAAGFLERPVGELSR